LYFAAKRAAIACVFEVLAGAMTARLPEASFPPFLPYFSPLGFSI
jgi:hypothetical protein